MVFQIYLSHNKNLLPTKLPDNVEQVSGLKSVSGSCVTLNDGSTLTIDDVIFCTGYKYSFDFLSPEYVQVVDGMVKPLYRQLVNINFPDSLFFVGVNFLHYFSGFAVCDRQAQSVARILEGSIKMPSKEEMLAESESGVRTRPKGSKE